MFGKGEKEILQKILLELKDIRLEVQILTEEHMIHFEEWREKNKKKSRSGVRKTRRKAGKKYVYKSHRGPYPGNHKRLYISSPFYITCLE
jgi:hypothetical protein